MKSIVSILLLLTGLMGSAATGYIPDDPNTSRLIVSIGRNDFKQEYKLTFTKNGTDEINDMDALKIGEGHVSIAGLINGLKLSIDQRAMLKGAKEIKLYVKGWATGNYTLRIKGKETFGRLTRITLIDRYTNKREFINTAEKDYSFQIDLNDHDSQGTERFSLLFEEQETRQDLSSPTEMIYPNPFSDKLFIKITSDRHAHAIVIIRNSLGALLSKQLINLQQNDPEINVEGLTAGIYFIQLIDKSNNKTISTFKVLKK